MGTLGNQSNAEISEKDLVFTPDKHIFGLDIAVNHTLTMSILYGKSNLLNVVHN